MKNASLVLQNTLFAFIVAGAIWHGSLHAESPVELGATIEAKNSVTLRSSPPTQKFLFLISKPGDKVSKIQEGEKFIVKDVKEVSVPFGKDVWVKGVTTRGDTGWVYYGEKDKPVNFIGVNKARE